MNTNKFPEQQSVSNICINDDSNIASNNISSLPNLPKIKIQKNTTKLFNSSNLETEKIQLDTKKKKKCFITSLNTDKMRFDINQLIIDNEKGKEKIDEFEERILKLKIFQTYQKERLQKLLNDDKFNIQDRIDYIIKMYKTYENIYFEYNCDLNAYFRFLFEISNELDVNLKIMTRQKKDMLYSIEVLVDRIIKVKKYNMVTKTDDFIAIKFIPSDQILPYHFKKVRKNWIPAWHGTKYNCIKSILKNGLKESGSILKDFGEIKTRDDHIQDNETFNNIQNWSKAVFTSPSLFYCIHPTYSERIDSSFFQNKYAILIEARLRPNSFQTFESTTGSRKTLVGEPLLLEYRVKSVDKYNNKNIYVISITFVSEKFLQNVRAYDQGDILSNSEAERIVYDD